jgi:hypothetical protein
MGTPQVAAGSWILNPGSEEEARELLRGIEEGDPAVLDALLSSPLSGEFAGDPLPIDILGTYGMNEDDDAASDVLSAYEDAYGRGVEDEAVRSARALLGAGEQS